MALSRGPLLCGLSPVPHPARSFFRFPYTFLSVELEGKAARVTVGVGRALLATDGGEAEEGRRALPDGREQLGLAVLRQHGRGHLKVAMCAGALGVHHALRDTLAVKVRELVDQVKVLQKPEKFKNP